MNFLTRLRDELRRRGFFTANGKAVPRDEIESVLRVASGTPAPPLPVIPVPLREAAP